MLMVSVDG